PRATMVEEFPKRRLEPDRHYQTRLVTLRKQQRKIPAVARGRERHGADTQILHTLDTGCVTVRLRRNHDLGTALECFGLDTMRVTTMTSGEYPRFRSRSAPVST